MGQNKRLLSLDVFRGITIVAMIIVNDPGSWTTVYSPLLHSEWHGCTLTDLIFPFFLFIVGMAISLSLHRIADNKEAHKKMIWMIFKRSMVLFAIGLFLNAFPYFDLYELRIPGVLQRIAVVFFICAVIFLKTRWQTQVIASAVILIAYWLVMMHVPVPEIGAGNLEPGTNLAAWIDYQLLNGHMWSVTGTWDPEGVFTTIPAVVTGLIGMLAGRELNNQRTEREKVIHLFLLANALIIAGLLWGQVFPINKSLWTSSYVLFTGGIAVNFLVVLYWLLDVKMYRSKFWMPFKVFGVNAIFIYVLSMLLANVMASFTLADGISVQSWIFAGLQHFISDPYLSSLIYALLFTLLMYFPVWGLYKKNIIIKV